MTAQSDRADLETVRSLAGATAGPEQHLGLVLARELAEQLPDVPPQTRARVALHIGRLISQTSGATKDGSGVIWGNAVLIAAVNQGEA